MKILKFVTAILFITLSIGINVNADEPISVEKVSADEVLIDESILIKDDFSWSFLPFCHRVEQETIGIGYFIPTEIYKVSHGNQIGQVNRVSLAKYSISTEELLQKIEEKYQNYCKYRKDSYALFLVDAAAQVEMLIRLDLGEYDHWLFLKNGGSVYGIYGGVSTDVWQDFLEEFLTESHVKVNGVAVKSAVYELDESYVNTGSRKKIFIYDNFIYRLSDSSAMLNYVPDREGFELSCRDKDYLYGEGHVLSSISMKIVDNLPKYETEEEMLAYFQEKYPQMDYYAVHPVEFKNIYGDRKKYLYKNAYRYVKSGDTYYIYYNKKGDTYEITYQGVERALWSLRSDAGYDYNEIFTWTKDEEGTIIQGNLVTEDYYLEKNVDGDTAFVFCIRRNEEIVKETEIGEQAYIIEIYRKGEEEPFQIINEASAQWNPFSFEDFNVDGYSDLFIDYYYGANGGTAFHYVWSPSKEKFVKISEDLEYYGFYYMDPLTRRLYMHHHGSAVSGTETTYHWINETDYEVVKYFFHDEVWPRVGDEDYIEVIIREFKDNKEKILTEYIYTMDEYDADMNLLWDSYYADFVWEKEVKNHDTGEKYILRYAQDYQRDDNGEILPDECIDELYIYDDETRILNCFENESDSSYSQIIWQDGNQDGEEELIIKYEDGTSITYTWEQLLSERRVDYETR